VVVLGNAEDRLHARVDRETIRQRRRAHVADVVTRLSSALDADAHPSCSTSNSARATRSDEGVLKCTDARQRSVHAVR
jgi:hypothetical protein